MIGLRSSSSLSNTDAIDEMRTQHFSMAVQCREGDEQRERRGFHVIKTLF